jgi:alpha-L-fucosidase 2
MRLPLLLLASLVFAAPACAANFPDVEYSRPDGVPLQIDLETPDGAGPFPIVVFVHGGDFKAGNRKGTNRGVVEALRGAGIAWASVEYRLAPQYHYPAPINDLRSAVRFLKKHAPEYHLRGDRIALMGESAGVLLVSHYGAAVRGEDAVASIVGVSGTHDLYRRYHPVGPCFVNGAFVPNPHPGTPQFCMPEGISLFLNITGPGPEVERMIKLVSPKELVRKDMPPYLLLHGTADVNAPFEQSVFMQEAMVAAGARCDLIAVDHGGHGFGSWDNDPKMATYRPRMVEWLKSVLTR